MAGKRGSVTQLKNLQKKLSNFTEKENEDFYKHCVKLAAERVLAKTIKRTPVGKYQKSSGKKGGTLRRGWTVGEVTRKGDVYEIEVYNPVEYASYVEHGHRLKNDGFWEGYHMLKISVEEVDKCLPSIITAELNKKLKELLNGK